MHPHKILNYERENPGSEFPRYEEIRGVELQVLVDSFRKVVKAKPNATEEELWSAANSRSQQIPNLNAEAEDFDLGLVFSACGVSNLETLTVYVLWWFSEIDRLRAVDVVRHIHDIWYPAADDILIFDATLTWQIGIDYTGCVWFGRLDHDPLR